MALLTGYRHEEVPDIEAWFPKLYPEEKYQKEVMESVKNQGQDSL